MVVRINYLHKVTNPVPRTTGEDVHDDVDINKVQDHIATVAFIDDTDSPFIPEATDETIIANAASATIDINLADVANLTGHRYLIIKSDSSANRVRVDGNGSQKINTADFVDIEDEFGSLAIKGASTLWVQETNPAGSGEANTAANVGASGSGVFRDKTGVTLNFKKMIAGTNVSIVDSGDTLTFNVTAGLATNVYEGGVQVGGTALAPDFDATAFNVVENSGRAEIDPNFGTSAGTISEGNHGHTGTLDANARVAVRLDSAGSVLTRRRINLIQGSNVTIGISDDAGNEEIDVTISASGGGSASAGYSVPSALTSASINTAMGSTTYKKVGCESSQTYAMTSSARLRSTGQFLDVQHAILQCTSADGSLTGTSTQSVISIEGSGDGGSTSYQKVENFIIDLNNKSNHPVGISNLDGTTGTVAASGGNPDYTGPIDGIYKFTRIRDGVILGHNKAGVSAVVMRNTENLCIVEGVIVPNTTSNQANPTYVFDFYDMADTESAGNHGNLHVSHCRVSLGGSYGVGFRFASYENSGHLGAWAGCTPTCRDPMNRIKGSYLQVFDASDSNTSNSTGYLFAPGDGGGSSNNRGWMFDHITAEDCFTGIKFERLAGSSGVWGFDIGNFMVEDKTENDYSTATHGQRRGVYFVSAGFSGRLHDGTIMCQIPSASATWIGLDVSGMGTADNVVVDGVTFWKKSGHASATFTPVSGSNGKKGLTIENCPGYNPYSSAKDVDNIPSGTWTAVTNPWAKSATSDKGVYNENNSGTNYQAFPNSGTPYIIRTTKARVIITGGNVTSIAINGQTISGTSFTGILEVGETITVNWMTTNPTGVVFKI